jgi:hypothetical protein
LDLVFSCNKSRLTIGSHIAYHTASVWLDTPHTRPTSNPKRTQISPTQGRHQQCRRRFQQRTEDTDKKEDITVTPNCVVFFPESWGRRFIFVIYRFDLLVRVYFFVQCVYLGSLLIFDHLSGLFFRDPSRYHPTCIRFYVICLSDTWYVFEPCLTWCYDLSFRGLISHHRFSVTFSPYTPVGWSDTHGTLRRRSSSWWHPQERGRCW